MTSFGLARLSIQNCWIGFAALLAGCSSGPLRNSPGFVDEIARHAEAHRGQLLASGGPLLALRPEGGGVVLRIATPNYGHLFDVRFPRDPGGLLAGRDVSFLGTLQGTAAAREAYSGTVIEIEGLALKPVGGSTAVVPGQEALANSWLQGTLDLTSPAPGSSGELPKAVAAVASAPPPAGAAPVASPPLSAAVERMLRQWTSLSETERADFLRRAGLAR